MRLFLHKLMVDITRHPREVITPGIDFEWSNKLWVHNIFRVYEMLFGRRAGIRPGSTKLQDGTVQCFTWEDTLANIEASLRTLRVPKLSVVRVMVPQFSYAGVSMPSQYRLAIVVDTQVAGTLASGTTATTSFTVTGSNTLLIGHNVSLNAGAITGETYNGVAMISVTGSASQLNSDTSQMAQYVIVGVSGTANLVLSSGSGNKIQIGTSYTGVNQSVTPDSVNHLATVTAKPVTASTTVVAANCWLFCTIYADASASIAGAGAFLRQQGSNVTIAAYDTNGTVGTGSQSMTITTAGGAGDFAYIITSFKPVAGVVIKSGFFFLVPH